MTDSPDTPDHQNIWQALAAAQANLPQLQLDSEADAGQYSYRYLSLAALHAAVLPVLSTHGLAWVVTTTAEVATATLAHGATDTQIQSTWPIPAGRNHQDRGAALSYARRYMLLAMVGVAPAGEDDGEGEPPAERPQTPAQTPREELQDLLLLHVPHDHHQLLLGAYQQGAQSIGDLTDENVQRAVRALSTKHLRVKVLDGIAAKANPQPQEPAQPDPAPADEDPGPGVQTPPVDLTDHTDKAVQMVARAQVQRALKNGVSVSDINVFLQSDGRFPEVALGEGSSALQHLPPDALIAVASWIGEDTEGGQ